MWVVFEKWLERDPKQSVLWRNDYVIDLWWERNFYPDVYTLANDLHKRGLIDDGDTLDQAVRIATLVLSGTPYLITE